ncbi:MAG: OmpA family protein [Chryseolinea sp.]
MKFVFTFVFTISLFTLLAQRLTNASLQLVNIAYDELNPVLSPDGRTLYVTVANHPQNVGGKKDLGDIWFSRLTETNQWSALIHGGNQLNDKAFNGVAGFSSDGSEMYLLSHYDASGAARTQGIAVSRNNGGGWTAPQNIPIPYFQNKSFLLSGSLSHDQNVFVYSAETYGTKGVDDLYVTIKGSDGRWSEPKNLGSTLNTSFQELSPSLSVDGKTLYFSSNGRKGNGSFDVYFTTRLDESWSNWSAPVNMGMNVNTEGRELFYRTYPDLGLSIFTTTKNSDGYGDVKIYSADEPFTRDTTATVVKNSPDTVVKIVEIVREPGADKIVKVYGRVKDVKTGESINARITFLSPVVNQSITSTIIEGYHASVSSTNKYSLRIEANGYVSALENLDINTYEMKDLELNFALQPVAIGTTVNMKNVLFEQGKTTLLTESYPELDLVVSFLRSNPKVKIELEGYTDNRGIPAQNVKLSQARVDKVKSYLVSKGIDKKRIAGKGYGGANPIASNDNEETRQLNRRVEFTIKKF